MEKINFTQEFGASLKRRRKHLGYSQEYLAERAGLHRTYVCDVERGARNLSLQSIAKLAGALETSVAALFPAAGLVDETLSDASVDILLVEDNIDDVAMTIRAFKKARFRNPVRVVGDGAEALDYVFCRGKYARRQPQDGPFVILLDLHLPKIGGIEVLRQIKKDNRTRQIPTIILTVSQTNDDISECMRLGAMAYIVKPVDFQKLIGVTPLLKLDWALLKPKSAKNFSRSEPA